MPIRLTRSVKVLLISYFVAFVIQHTGDQFFNTHLLGLLGLVPASFFSRFQFWQIFTYSFLHGDVMHLVFNSMMLAFMGGELETAWGTPRFLRFYFFCATASALIYLLLQSTLMGGVGYYVPMIGASGAIYGLLMAYGLIFGERVLLFMMLFPMKAKHFVWILALIELMTTVYSVGGGVASLAHLGGMAAGFAYLWVRASWILARKGPALKGAFGQKLKKKKSSHLKLIVNNDKDLNDDEEDGSENNPRTWH